MNYEEMTLRAGVKEFLAFAQQHVRSSDNSPATINSSTCQLVHLSTLPKEFRSVGVQIIVLLQSTCQLVNLFTCQLYPRSVGV